jgi:signal peptidase II
MLIRRLGILVIAAAACAGCDQATKHLARTYLEDRPPISLMADSLRLLHVENAGAFLGLGASWPEAARNAVFLVAVPVILIAFAAYFVRYRATNRVGLAAAGLLVGGGLSNLVDRIAFGGAVTDFLNIGLGPLRTGIFNFADTAVLVGAIVLVLTSGERAGRDTAPPRETGGGEA